VTALAWRPRAGVAKDNSAVFRKSSGATRYIWWGAATPTPRACC